MKEVERRTVAQYRVNVKFRLFAKVLSEIRIRTSDTIFGNSGFFYWKSIATNVDDAIIQPCRLHFAVDQTSRLKGRMIMANALTLIEYSKNSKEGSLTVEKAKEILGWIDSGSLPDGAKLEGEAKFRDRNGNQVQLRNANQNRPFRLGLARRYANEILRNCWHLNGETVIVDSNDKIHDGQHRLVGFILADQMRQKDPEWKSRGKLTIEIVVIKGISPKQEVVDSIGIGQKRTLGDVLYRDKVFATKENKESVQKKLSNVLAGAVRLVWLRLGGKIVSDAPHFPHSEALAFADQHPKIVECVQFADGMDFTGILSKPYVAGLMYLMAASATDKEAYEAGERDEELINFDRWEAAEQFFTLLSSGIDLKKGSPILALRDKLRDSTAAGGKDRDKIVYWTIMAWNAYIDGNENFSKTDFKLKLEDGKVVEPPYIGGLDTEVVKEEEVEETEEVKEEKTPKAKKSAKKDQKKTGEKAPKAVKKAAKKAKDAAPYEVGDEVFVEYPAEDDNGKMITAKEPARVTEIGEETVKLILTAYDSEMEFGKEAKIYRA